MIKNFLYKAAALLLPVLLITSCSRNSNPVEKETVEILKTESLENVYGCTNTMALLSTGPAEPQAFLLIKNQEDFDKVVKSATCAPQVDFNKYTLLIGTKGLSYGCSSISYQLKKISTGNKDSLMLDVAFQLNDAAVAQAVCYHVLMPKQREGVPVKVNFEMKP